MLTPIFIFPRNAYPNIYKQQKIGTIKRIMFFRRCVAIKIAVFIYPIKAFTASFAILCSFLGARQR